MLHKINLPEGEYRYVIGRHNLHIRDPKGHQHSFNIKDSLGLLAEDVKAAHIRRLIQERILDAV